MKLITLLLFISIAFQGKSQERIDQKYLVALLYLKSDKHASDKIRSAFPYLDTAVTKLDYNVDSEIWYLPLFTFRYDLKENSWGIDSSLINNNDLFKGKFYFEHFKMPLISKLLPPTNSKLVLTFSKPFGNYLIAEILSTGPNVSHINKTGSYIDFLFVFDENGLIKKVLMSSSQYR